MSTAHLGFNVQHRNHLSGRDWVRADLAARILAAKLAGTRPAALIVLAPRLYSTTPDDGCDLCGGIGPVVDEVSWTEWETVRDCVTHIWLVHRRCLVPTIRQAVEAVAATRPDTVSVSLGLRRDVVPAAFYSPVGIAA